MRNTEGLNRMLGAAFVLLAVLPVSAQTQSIDTARLFKEDSPAVVLIIAQKSGTPISEGTGVLISKDGTIISALHVVEGADSAVVKLKSGDVYDKVSIVSFDPRRDLVILKVSGFDLPALPLGNSNNTKEGDPVALISNPKGLEGSITQGIVSAVRDIGDLGFKVIQTTAAASPGSSGGAIVNADGDLVAILSFKVTGGENLNFGIPVNYARGMLDSHDSFPLSQLASRIGETPVKPLSQISSAAPTDISGEWKSLMTGTIYTVRLEQSHAYIDRAAAEGQPQGMCDLQIDGGQYKGTCRAQKEVRWYDGWYLQWKTRMCQFQTQEEITKFSPSRIEGRTQTRGLGQEWTDKDKSKCGERFPLQWTDFVWIRPN